MRTRDALKYMALGMVLGLGLVALGYWDMVRLQTAYAPGFRKDRFLTLEPGASREEILTALGPPLSVRKESGQHTASGPTGYGRKGSNCQSTGRVDVQAAVKNEQSDSSTGGAPDHGGLLERPQRQQTQEVWYYSEPACANANYEEWGLVIGEAGLVSTFHRVLYD